jgi:hypothetical protein
MQLLTTVVRRGGFYLVFSVIVLFFLSLLLISTLTRETDSGTATQPSPTPVQRNVHTEKEPLVPSQNPTYLEEIKTQPWKEQMPYWTDHFKIDYRQSRNTIIIYTLATSNGDTAQYQRESLAYREEARAWLIKNGANLNQFTIEYSPAGF